MLLQPATNGCADALYVMAHGAGGHMEHATMDGLAAAVRGAGIDVARFNFLYREKGRGGPDRMPKLQACFAAVVDSVRTRVAPRRLLIGGQSMGGRCASMLAADGFATDGLLLLAYPLHPAGKPAQLRSDHLSDIEVPTLLFNGTRDSLCQQELMDEALAELPSRFTMHWLEGSDHGYKVLKRSGRTQQDVFDEIGAATRSWLAGL